MFNVTKIICAIFGLACIILLVFVPGCSNPIIEECPSNSMEVNYCRLDDRYSDGYMIYQEGEGYIDVPFCDSCITKTYQVEPDTFWFTYYIYMNDTLSIQVNKMVSLISDTIIQLN